MLRVHRTLAHRRRHTFRTYTGQGL